MGDFEFQASLDEDVEKALNAGLAAHAAANGAPAYQDCPLTFSRRDAQGRVVAGLTGKTFWNWLYIDTLWVDPSLQKQGIGGALVAAAEKEALRRGCRAAYLWTESWEGPDFYSRLGYEQFIALADFPVGHKRMGFMKRLAA